MPISSYFLIGTHFIGQFFLPSLQITLLLSSLHYVVIIAQYCDHYGSEDTVVDCPLQCSTKTETKSLQIDSHLLPAPLLYSP